MTLVEYGDLECPYCGQAEPTLRALLAAAGRPALRLAPPPAARRPPARRSRPPRRPRRPPSRAPSGRCTTCSSHTRTHCGCPTWPATRAQLGLDPERFSDDLHKHAGAARIARGRRRRRPERRFGDADLLHQRPPPLRRLRSRLAHARGRARAGAGGSRHLRASARRVRARPTRSGRRRNARSAAPAQGYARRSPSRRICARARRCPRRRPPRTA